MLFALIALASSPYAHADAYLDGLAKYRELQARFAHLVEPVDRKYQAAFDALNSQLDAKKAERLACGDFDCAKRVQDEYNALLPQIGQIQRQQKVEQEILERPFQREGRELLLATFRAMVFESLQKATDLKVLQKREHATCEDIGGLSLSPAALCFEIDWDYRIGERFYRQTRLWMIAIPNVDGETGRPNPVMDPDRLTLLTSQFEDRGRLEYLSGSGFLSGGGERLEISRFGSKYSASDAFYRISSGTLRFEVN
jgi:hypothetical protein